MELLIFGLNEPEKICGSQEDPDDVCEWKGVKCNADKEVENFRWLMKRQEGTGTLSLAFLPYTMKKATMVGNALSGTIQLADLPESMEELLLIQNKLSGSFCLDSLPGAMRKLYLSKNNFNADPMDGQLYVVGRTSTPSWGKPGATRCCWDPPWQYRVATGASTVYHCRGPLRGVSGHQSLSLAASERAHACRKKISFSFSPATDWGRAPESGADPPYSPAKHLRPHTWEKSQPSTQGKHSKPRCHSPTGVAHHGRRSFAASVARLPLLLGCPRCERWGRSSSRARRTIQRLARPLGLRSGRTHHRLR
ncbi:hypothetical protein XU18_1675 [Perkinsela sp. CCAP 1560/4]|nr:hypothetical protein XU18_1675 [Perkinsela sp. CCAP 1560/4]|eukprot:KNH07674.1 hypothetical protein XU18_1675 [Perkinsela sp. CCAP 1560/4]